jgi:hypothetical protein
LISKRVVERFAHPLPTLVTLLRLERIKHGPVLSIHL